MHELTLEQFRANYWYATKNMIDKDRVEAEIPTFDQFMDWAVQQTALHAVFFDIKVPGERADLAEVMISHMDSIVNARSPTWRPVYITPHPSVWQAISAIIGSAGLSLDIDLGGGLVDKDYCAMASSSYARQRGRGFATTMHPFVWTESPWTTLKNLLLCDLQSRDIRPDSNGVKLVEKVIAATIDDEEKMECLLNMGVDGLITNEPARLRSVAQRLGKKY
jgi:glycerophosphoryl diester phosphodiesterase